MNRLVAIAGLITIFTLGLRAEAPKDAANQAPPAIQTVTIGPNREYLINGKPFLPIFGWLQQEDSFPKVKAAGMNSLAGYWREKDGTGWMKSEDKFGAAVSAAGFYYMPSYDSKYPEEMARIKGAPWLLAWMQGDEPDLPHDASETKINGDKLAINPGRPLAYLTDGNDKTSAVLSPMEGGEVTIQYPKAMKVVRFALGNGTDGTKASAVDLVSEGKVILHAPLPNSTEMKTFDLPAPVMFSELTLKVVAVHPSADGKPNPNWGTFTGVDGFDASGTNVLKFPVRKEPQVMPAEVVARYRDFKKFDATRPMLVTFSSMYLKDLYDGTWYTTAQANALYPGYVNGADIFGIDIYPIYGWNQPENIDWVAKATKQQRELVGPNKPLYQWIETCNGNFGANTKPVTGREIRNEVYQALACGCTAIGYFTHVFAPQFNAFAVPPENQDALKKLNAELTELTPQLLGPDAKQQPELAIAGNLKSLCHAKSDGKRLTVIALNMDGKNQAGAGVIKLPGLKAGATITVHGENRVIKAEDGQWKDDFAPLAVHIYQLDDVAHP